MNIFYLHPNPKLCAAQHVDKHCVKMILEYAQLLSTAHRILDGHEVTELTANGRRIKRWKLESPLDQILYKSTHSNHPSAIWVRQSKENYIWLANMLLALCEEYTYRYGKIHKVERDGLSFVLLKNIPANIGNKSWSEPTPAMPDEYKAKTSIQSYHNFYNGPKAHFAKWTKRPTPSWFNG